MEEVSVLSMQVCVPTFHQRFAWLYKYFGDNGTGLVLCFYCNRTMHTRNQALGFETFLCETHQLVLIAFRCLQTHKAPWYFSDCSFTIVQEIAM